MYRGKFESGNRGGSVPAGARENPYGGQNRTGASQGRTAQPGAQNRTGASQGRTGGKSAAPTRVEQPQKRGPRTGGVIFYTLYFLMIAAFVVGMMFTLRWLEGWLVSYEASQPSTKSQEVFDQLFEVPDWGRLYDMAGVEDTPYEGKDAYVSYMTQKVGSSPLSFLETSGGLRGKKYLVRLGEENIAAFTLSGDTERITDIPEWNLGTVELLFDREDGYLIQKQEGHTVYINGAPLDDSFTIQIASTKAQDYLPIGTTAPRTCIQRIDGLMVRPEVTIHDQNGEDMEVTYDEATGMFVEQTEANTITEELETRAIEAAQAYCYYAQNVSKRELPRYFDTAGSAYKQVTALDSSWTKTGSSNKFMNVKVSEYARYSDSIFSARVTMDMNIVRSDGTVKVIPIDVTLFFSLKNDKWMVYEMTNEDIQTPVGQVRLTYKNGDTVLDSAFVSTDATELMTPVVAAPDGQVFSGWLRETVDESGKKVMELVFTPDETGKVTLPAGTTLEPMTLTPYFEDATKGGGV